MALDREAETSDGKHSSEQLPVMPGMLCSSFGCRSFSSLGLLLSSAVLHLAYADQRNNEESATFRASGQVVKTIHYKSGAQPQRAIDAVYDFSVAVAGEKWLIRVQPKTPLVTNNMAYLEAGYSDDTLYTYLQYRSRKPDNSPNSETCAE